MTKADGASCTLTLFRITLMASQTNFVRYPKNMNVTSKVYALRNNESNSTDVCLFQIECLLSWVYSNELLKQTDLIE